MSVARLNLLFYRGRYDETIDEAHKLLELAPRFPWAKLVLGEALYATERFPEALAAYAEINPPFLAASFTARAYSALGETAKAEKILAELEQATSEMGCGYYWVASLCSRLGKTDKALHYLEKAYEERSPAMFCLPAHPTWDAMRHEPRFQTLLVKLGLGDDQSGRRGEA